MKPYYEHAGITIYHGDVLECLAALPEESVHCVVTSPPYWGLRDYGCAGQIGLEATPEEYIAKMVVVFRKVRRVLRKDGTCWVNMGDGYCATAIGSSDQSSSKLQGGKTTQIEASKRPDKRGDGLKPKDLIGMPWRLAFALQLDGWWLRQDIIWSKPNPMPESVTDRCTKAHEYIFLLTKSAKYYFDQDAILEPASPATNARLQQNVQAQIGSKRANGGAKTNGTMKAVGRKLAESGSMTKNNESFDAVMAIMPEKRNKRSVWTIVTESFSEAHFATFPTKLVDPCILAGCPAGGTVLDPFLGSGTTALVATRLNCKAIGIELNAKYIEIAAKRLAQEVMEFGAEGAR